MHMKRNDNGTGNLIGTSGVILELTEEIERVARSDAKVLITGESGVGKELVAHAIHARSPRVRASWFRSTAPACRKRCSSPSCSGT